MGDAGKGLWQLCSVSLIVSERAGPGPWFPTLGLTSGSPRELSTPGQVQVSQTSGGGSPAIPGMALPLEPLLAPIVVAGKWYGYKASRLWGTVGSGEPTAGNRRQERPRGWQGRHRAPAEEEPCRVNSRSGGCSVPGGGEEGTQGP